MWFRLNVVIIGFALLGLGIGYTQDNTLTGTWKGYVHEQDHAAIMVGLTLEQSSAGITGSFSILSETRQDVEKGASFELVQIVYSGGLLKFIVPITGKIDSDAVSFELYLRGNRLEGYGHELREGSERLEVQFFKDQ